MASLARVDWITSGARCSLASAIVTASRSPGPASSMIASAWAGSGGRLGQTKSRAVVAAKTTQQDQRDQRDPSADDGRCVTSGQRPWSPRPRPSGDECSRCDRVVTGSWTWRSASRAGTTAASGPARRRAAVGALLRGGRDDAPARAASSSVAAGGRPLRCRPATAVLRRAVGTATGSAFFVEPSDQSAGRSVLLGRPRPGPASVLDAGRTRRARDVLGPAAAAVAAARRPHARVAEPARWWPK